MTVDTRTMRPSFEFMKSTIMILYFHSTSLHIVMLLFRHLERW